MPHSRRAVLLILLLASGGAALVYEVLWVRLLCLVVGNTVQATTTVLGAFMAGLALGSAAAARWLSPPRIAPLRAYALFELGIALWALLLPLLLDLPIPLYRALHGGPWLGVARIACCFAVLLPATALMGATLPVLAQVVTASGSAARSVGLLYAVNTLGGVAGTLLAGFWTLPTWGTNGTALFAVSLNVGVAAVAWQLGSGAQWRIGAEPADAGVAAANRFASVAVAATFASGLVSLALEVVWIRVLNLLFGTTTYAFSIVLATFLAGIALGSEAARRWADATRAAVFWMGLTLLATAISVLGLAFSVEALPVLYLRVLARLGLTFQTDLLARIAVAAVFLIPPTLLFGALFPLAVRAQVERRGTGRGTGEVYASNTIGAILGSALGGFVLLPLFGMQRSVEVLGLALAIAGVLIVLGWGEAKRATRFAAAALGTVAVGVLLAQSAPWDRKLLSAGVYMEPSFMISTRTTAELRRSQVATRLIHFAEGLSSTVSVTELHGMQLSFLVDGKTEISMFPTDRRLGRMLGHLPVLLHPHPRRALNIGLGAGLTVGALTRHPELTQIDVVELEPEVKGVARVFAPHNNDVLSDPRVNVVINDGRNHLLLSGVRYDVITSDPFEPTVSGAASLFTKDHFELIRQSLAPGGVACQWLPLYELGPREYGSVLTAFLEVFPYVTTWFTGTDSMMIGSEQPLHLDYSEFERRLRLETVSRDLDDVGLADPARLLGSFLFDATLANNPGPAVPANTDAAPYLEFAAPRRRWMPMVEANLEALRLIKRRLPDWITYPDDASRRRTESAFESQRWSMAAFVAWRTRRADAARAAAEEALKLDAGNPWAIDVFVDWAVKQAARARAAGKITDEAALLARAHTLDPRAVDPLGALAHGALIDGRWNDARPWLDQLLALWPNHLAGRMMLAALSDATGDRDEAERVLRDLVRDFPDYPNGLLALADLALARGGADESRALVHKAASVAPDDPLVREAVKRAAL